MCTPLCVSLIVELRDELYVLDSNVVEHTFAPAPARINYHGRVTFLVSR